MRAHEAYELRCQCRTDVELPAMQARNMSEASDVRMPIGKYQGSPVNAISEFHLRWTLRHFHLSLTFLPLFLMSYGTGNGWPDSDSTARGAEGPKSNELS